MSRLFQTSPTARLAVCSSTFLFLVAALMVSGMGRSAIAQKPVSGKAALGKATFDTQCSACHHKAVGDTTPFGPPNLHGIIGTNTSTTPPQITAQEATEQIKKGKGVMPPFEGKLTPAEISNVVAFLKTQ